MEKNELISVIVPVYNDEKYISKCINCLKNQSYVNLEIILVVDGASDNSYEICKKESLGDKRIKVFYKENGGTADARNYGIVISKGKYIGFMDSDDYIPNYYFEKLYEIAKKSNADISAVGLKEIDELEESKFINNDGYTVFNKEEMFSNLFNDNLFGNFVWNKLFKRDLFNEVKFNKIKKIEDMDIMYRLFDVANNLAFNESKLYCWVQREGSQLHNIDKDHYYDKYKVVKKRYLLINEQYPDMAKNKLYFAKVILECYPYIYKTHKKELKDDFDDLFYTVKPLLSIKDKIKKIMFQL